MAYFLLFVESACCVTVNLSPISKRKKLYIESKTMLVQEDLIRKEKDNNFFEGELKLEDQVGR